MAKGQSYYGSIDLTTLLKQANMSATGQPHSACVRAGKENKAFVQITLWVNEEADQYGNHAAIKMNSKDAATAAIEGNIYLGNLKKSEAKQPAPLEAGASDIPSGDDDGLPF